MCMPLQFDGTFCDMLKFSLGEIAILSPLPHHIRDLSLSDAQGNLSAVQNLLEILCCIKDMHVKG